MINFTDMNGDASTGFSGSLNPAETNDEIHNIFHQVMDFFATTNYFMMKPHPEMVDNGYCLAAPGKEYLVYLENGETVNINSGEGKYHVKWINACDFTLIIDGGITTNGKNLKSPDSGSDWFVHLESL